MTNAWVALGSITLSSASSSVTFGSIPSGYRDLILTWEGAVTDSDRAASFRFNGDTSSVYSRLALANTASSTNSGSASDFFYAAVSGAKATATLHFMDYSATDKHKTVIGRSGDSTYAFMYTGRYAKVDQITSITILTTTTSYSSASTFTSGSTFTLYGSNRL